MSSCVKLYESSKFFVHPVVLLCCCQNLQSELGSKIFRELLEYVSTCHSRVSDVSRPHVSLSEIPAAAVVLGWCCFTADVFEQNSVELVISLIAFCNTRSGRKLMINHAVDRNLQFAVLPN